MCTRQRQGMEEVARHIRDGARITGCCSRFDPGLAFVLPVGRKRQYMKAMI